MNQTANIEYLLTPGPLTTTLSVKQAMLRDWGSRDLGFIAITSNIRERLVKMVGGEDTHVCVPVQGSGTFAVEATLGTLVPKSGKVLVLVNGAYGRRVEEILSRLGREYLTHETDEDVPCSVQKLDEDLMRDPSITHVVIVHCETTSGLLNPVQEVARVVANHGRRLMVDSMSAFGAIPIDVNSCPFDALIASSNKCLEGVPGIGYAIIRKESLREAEGNSHSLSLDLYDQWRGFHKNGQWRFTPPTHVLASFEQALLEHEEEGGVRGRGARYQENCDVLMEGMVEMGFKPFLSVELQAPIILTFYSPADGNFDFEIFYKYLAEKGYLIYPGKLTRKASFRIGCIGQVHPGQMREALSAIRDTINRMGVKSCAPDLN